MIAVIFKASHWAELLNHDLLSGIVFTT